MTSFPARPGSAEVFHLQQSVGLTAVLNDSTLVVKTSDRPWRRFLPPVGSRITRYDDACPVRIILLQDGDRQDAVSERQMMRAPQAFPVPLVSAASWYLPLRIVA